MITKFLVFYLLLANLLVSQQALLKTSRECIQIISIPLNRHPERQAAEGSWRTSLLIEYLSVGTYYNDHADIYVSGPAETPGTPVVYHRGPWSPDNTSQGTVHTRHPHRVGERGVQEEPLKRVTAYQMDNTT